VNLSQKCQYAVRAILELSRRHRRGAVPAMEIAASQAVPKRFMEVILNELKPSGLVGSRRGARGGYFLTRPPGEITIGEVIRLIDGPLDPVRCTSEGERTCCPLQRCCALTELWGRAKQAVTDVYDATSFQDLADRAQALERRDAPDYSI
jgi:Rrf2 family protein